MRKKATPRREIEDVEILDMSSTGKAVAKHDGQVIFVERAVPGDIADLQIIKNKKTYLEAKVIRFKKRSELLRSPACRHFGQCGGCKWQDISYMAQLLFKQKQVEDNLSRIGKVDLPPLKPIIASENEFRYRNKLEYTFSNKKWLTFEEMAATENKFQPGLGFHMPGQFDKVLDITECHLQDTISDRIRNFVKEKALDSGLTFYDIRLHRGLLRNLVVRTTTTGDLMVILQIGENSPDEAKQLLDHLTDKFHEITSCFLVINQKHNDSFGDLTPQLHSGKDHILEKMSYPDGSGEVFFRIGPKSFFQTNTWQSEVLYKLTYQMAEITKNDLVYDLYTGTGTIANYLARSAKKVIGIEYVEEAVIDARENARMNGHEHLSFYAGDMKDLLTKEFITKNGTPDIVITDPPRAGMHEDVCKRLLEASPRRIVYVSCNPATQARDIEILSEKYRVTHVQPVDMFPHTPHVENIACLDIK